MYTHKLYLYINRNRSKFFIKTCILSLVLFASKQFILSKLSLNLFCISNSSGKKFSLFPVAPIAAAVFSTLPIFRLLPSPTMKYVLHLQI